MKIINLQFPNSSRPYGLFNLYGMPNVYYSFELAEQGEVVLMEEIFAENQPENEKFKQLSRDSNMYKTIQQLLNEHIEKNELVIE